MDKNYYNKYLKYKKKYKVLQNLCKNMETYANTMDSVNNYNGKNIHLTFNYLDNWNESYQEASNFLQYKDYNMEYLNNCIKNLNKGVLCDGIKYYINEKIQLTEIIIVSIGSSSTQSYYFNQKDGIFKPHVIELHEGKWYGVQNYEDKENNLVDLYTNISLIAKKHNKKYIILHKSGSFGFKHIDKPEIVIPIDNKLPKCVTFNEEELKNKKNYDAFMTLQQLITTIVKNKKIDNIVKWLSVGNFSGFKADWIENVSVLYFKKNPFAKQLYIMDFGGGSNSLKKITNNNGIIVENLFSGVYNQPTALSLINTDELREDVINHYRNEGQTITIKEQILKAISNDMKEQEKISVYIFQTGLQREFGDTACKGNVKLRKFFTKESDLW